MSYVKTFTVSEVITPEDAAAAFAGFGSDEQAIFFNLIAKIVDEEWNGVPFCMQMQYVTDDDELTPAGRSIMRTIGDYADQHRRSI